MAHLDSPHWHGGLCNKHLLPSIPCPQCLATKDEDLYPVFTSGDRVALEWDENLSPADLLPVGFEYLLQRQETKVIKQRVWSWTLQDFKHHVFSLEGVKFPTFDIADDFILQIIECDHFVKFPDFFDGIGSDLQLDVCPDSGDAFFFYYEARAKIYLFHQDAEVLGRNFVNRKMGW